MKTLKFAFTVAALVAVLGVFAGCGDKGDTSSPAHTHIWGEWLVTTPATMEVEGLEINTCLICGKTETRAIPKLVHTHQWGYWNTTKEATCIAEGSRTRTCILDSTHTETSTIQIDPNAHAWGKWVVTKQATISEDGSEKRTCSLDSSHDETRTKSRIIGSIASLNEYLSDLASNSRDTPYSITLNIDDLTGLSTSITNSGKYIDLDLSGGDLTTIPVNAFLGCSFLTGIIIPETVTSIGIQAFTNCYYLKSINIPEGLASIGNSAFASAGLISITIPSSVIDIGAGALAADNGLTEIIVDPNNAAFCSVDGILYNKELTTLIQYPAYKEGATVTVSANITSIVIRAFMNARNLTAINVDTSNSVYCSVDGVLYNKELTTLIQYPNARSGNLIVPNGVTDISDVSFNGSIVNSITLPASITNIGSQAFINCFNLASVTFQGNITEANFSSNAFQGSDLREKYFAVNGGIGTYTRAGYLNNDAVWTKQ
jgi:hypothetical protein